MSIAMASNNQSAVHRTFAITEILESILLHLPPRRIFIVKRVSKDFSNTIAGSIALRKRLVFTSTACTIHKASLTRSGRPNVWTENHLDLNPFLFARPCAAIPRRLEIPLLYSRRPLLRMTIRPNLIAASDSCRAQELGIPYDRILKLRVLTLTRKEVLFIKDCEIKTLGDVMEAIKDLDVFWRWQLIVVEIELWGKSRIRCKGIDLERLELHRRDMIRSQENRRY